MAFLNIFTTYAVPFIVVLTILVFVHELGHYLIARWNGVRVEVFSIGFGPEVFGWTDKAGTRWKISILPLGGYVRMFGDANAASAPDQEILRTVKEEDKKHTLHGKTVWQRIAVIAAGPLANYLFAIGVFTVLFAVVGQRYTPAEIGFVQAGSPAEQGGLIGGDRVLEVENVPVQRFEDMQVIISENAGKPLSFKIARGGRKLDILVIPERKVVTDIFGNLHEQGFLGVGRQGAEYIKRNPIQAFGYACKETFSLTTQTLASIGQMFIGMRSTNELGGPLRIAQLSGEIAQLGLPSLFWFMGVLSVSLGLINFFPIPMLDGGHLVFYVMEVITGKPVKAKTQERWFQIGFFIIVGLMAFSFWNDLKQLQVIEKIMNLFG